jgi:integrase
MPRKKLSKNEIRKRTRAGAYHDGSKALSAKKVAKLRAEGRYHDAQVPGLYLQVTKRKSDAGATSAKANSAKSWLLRFELNGKERMMGLGSAAIFNLKQARERARSARQLLADGIDPLQTKHATKAAAKAAAAKALTFREAAQRYFDQHQAKWTNASHREQFLSSLTKHATVLLTMDVAAIDTALVLRAIEPIWTTKAITADRVRNRIESVLDWCVVRGHRAPGTNPARWKGHLDQVLPAPRKLAPVKHHRALDYKALPSFAADLSARDDSVAARALQFLILTATRSGEVLGATWDEMIDLDGADPVWVIPAPRTKPKKMEHRVPLTPQAVALLRDLPTEADNPYCFIGPQPGARLSKMAFTRVLQGLGRNDTTTHGLRASFRTWAGGETNYAREVCERALGHIIGSPTETAYDRGDLFKKRRGLMSAWSKFVTKPLVRAKGKADNVVPIQGRSR